MKKNQSKKISVTAQMDNKFVQSPDVSGYRFIFWTEAVHGVFYLSKKATGKKAPEEIKLTLNLEKE